MEKSENIATNWRFSQKSYVNDLNRNVDCNKSNYLLDNLVDKNYCARLPTYVGRLCAKESKLQLLLRSKQRIDIPLFMTPLKKLFLLPIYLCRYLLTTSTKLGNLRQKQRNTNNFTHSLVTQLIICICLLSLNLRSKGNDLQMLIFHI